TSPASKLPFCSISKARVWSGSGLCKSEVVMIPSHQRNPRNPRLNFLFFVEQLRIKLARTFGAHAVRKLRIRMVPDKELNLVPVTLVVADLFAVRTDWQQAAQRLHVRQRLL